MFTRIFLFLVFLLLPVVMQAQSGLNINQVFQGKVVPISRMVETRVRGRAISKYKLSYYRSARMTLSENETMQIRSLFDKDCLSALDEKISRKGKNYENSVICLPVKAGINRFLCLQFNVEGDKYKVTIVYMEGQISSLKELRKLLK